ncbi:MAG TPA: hypothetical protein VH877_23400 [Polyangia bacterium]|jgi:hypothetical protein|nr:hypothetical protein [Polyangia bacterium]
MKVVTLLVGLAALLSGPALAHAREDRTGPFIAEGGETGHRLHMRLDAAATYAIGGYSALGVQLHLTGYTPVWNTRRATGTFDVGLLLGWQNEPQFVEFPRPPRFLSNDTHRLNAWATVGHSFYIGQHRRFSLGLHVFAGWTHVWSVAAINDTARALKTRYSDNYGLFNAGALLKFDYRFSRYLGLTAHIGAPFQFQPSYVATLAQVGIGLTGYLR